MFSSNVIYGDLEKIHLKAFQIPTDMSSELNDQRYGKVKLYTLIGYEKISQKLTFYKSFFSPQWKFLIHTILQCLSAKTTAWNEFSSTMASAIICLATNQKFNFSKYIFESMVKNLKNVSGKFLMYPRRVGKGFSGRTPLFPTMVVQAQAEMGEGSANPTDPHHTPTIIQPSTSQPQKTQRPRRQRERTLRGCYISADDPVTTAGEVVTTASVEIPEELTVAQTLIEIKSAKPKAEEQAPVSTPIVYPSQLPQAKDKGKAKMAEPEKPLKKKDQIAINKEVARNLEAQLQAELEEEERLSRQKEEEANIALIESWDNTQAMMDADFQ
ncbi:hypothetical protein Tco_1046774, partial [Tanacetum coccineum]